MESFHERHDTQRMLERTQVLFMYTFPVSSIWEQLSQTVHCAICYCTQPSEAKHCKGFLCGIVWPEWEISAVFPCKSLFFKSSIYMKNMRPLLLCWATLSCPNAILSPSNSIHLLWLSGSQTCSKPSNLTSAICFPFTQIWFPPLSPAFSIFAIHRERCCVSLVLFSIEWFWSLTCLQTHEPQSWKWNCWCPPHAITTISLPV